MRDVQRKWSVELGRCDDLRPRRTKVPMWRNAFVLFPSFLVRSLCYVLMVPLRGRAMCCPESHVMFNTFGGCSDWGRIAL